MTDPAAETDDPERAGLAVIVERDGHVVVRLRGELTQQSSPAVAVTLAPLLRDADCVVVDVSRLDLDHPATLSVLATALLDAGGWPIAKLVILSGNPGMDTALREAGVAQLVAFTARPDQARRHCDRRPPEVRASWRLPTGLHAPGQARQLVHDRLEVWGCSSAVTTEAVLVVNELVTNVVEHADTAMRIDVSFNDGGLRCSVHDACTSPAQLRAPTTTGGYGLYLVDALARQWGCTVHPDGKTVWALLWPGPLTSTSPIVSPVGPEEA